MNFALIGVAGYVAPRHLRAIKDTGNRLVAALDIHDSVGVLDQYFPEADFFTEMERFDRHVEKLKKVPENTLDYISICTPNYLHDAHTRFGLRSGANVICEKPLVINPWNLESLRETELSTGKKVYTVMQLRYHPALVELKRKVSTINRGSKVVMTYITPRGNWYATSWKGSDEKSGGIATNIGIHLFDLLYWLFGDCRACELHLSEHNRMAGYLELEKAEVTWLLSVDQSDLHRIGQKDGFYSFRSLLIDDEQINFSDGFMDLHSKVYQEIIDGRGLGIADAEKSVYIAHRIRTSPLQEPQKGHYHPYLSR